MHRAVLLLPSDFLLQLRVTCIKVDVGTRGEVGLSHLLVSLIFALIVFGLAGVYWVSGLIEHFTKRKL